MSNGRTITIDILINDGTKSKVKGIQKELETMDKQAARLANRFKTFSTQKWEASMRLLDRVTDPASRIRRLLQKIAGKAWQISFKVADGALAGVRKIESALMRITNRAWSVAVNVKGAAAGMLNGLMSGAMLGAGAFAPLGAMAGVGFGAANAVSAYSGFEYQMSKVRALTQLDKNSAEFLDLQEQAKQLGRTTEWTRTQVAEAQFFMAKAGWKYGQIKNATPAILNLATASDTDLGTTSDILTDVMTAAQIRAGEIYQDNFGNQVEVSKRMADIMAATVTNSNTGMYELGDALKYSAPIVGAMYSDQDIQKRMQGMEDLLILTGLMSSGGVKASQAGTSARAMFQRFGSENRNALYGLKFADVDFVDKLTGNVRPVIDIMKDLNRAFNQGVDPTELINFAEEMEGTKLHADTRRKIESLIGNAQAHGGKLGGGDRLKLASMLAGTEAMSGILLGVTGDIEALEKQIRGANGAAEEMAGVMRDNLAGSFKLLGSAWDSFQQGLLEGKAGAGLRSFVDTLTEIISRADRLFSDGIHFADFGKIIGDVLGRLKNKFLELNSIGSLLAGGALVFGLNKIIGLSRRALNALKGVGQAGAAGTRGLSSAASVSTMTVHANVVNLNGAIRGGYGGVGGIGGIAGVGGYNQREYLAMAQAKAGAANLKLAQLQAKQLVAWQALASERAFVTGGTKLTALTAQAEKVSTQVATAQAQARQANRLVAQLNSAIAADAYNAKRARELAKLNAPPPTANTSSRWAGMKSAAGGAAAFAGLFSLLDIMSLKSANAERVAAASENERAIIAHENRKAEWEASVGGLGAVVGAGLGAALGSLAGPMGTMIGGIVGSAIGEKLGQYFGDKGAEREVIRDGVNKTVLDKEIDSFLKPDFSFGAKQTSEKTFESFAKFDEQALAWSGSAGKAVQTATQEVRSLEQQLEKDFQTWKTDFKYQNARAKDFSKQWQFNSSGYDYYQQQANEMWNRIYRGGNEHGGGGGGGSFDEHWGTAGVKPISALSRMLENIFFSRTQAAELNPEQQMQMAAMEGGTVASKVMAPFALPEAGMPPEMPDITGVTEQIYSDLEALQEGVSEVFGGFGEQITEQLTTAFEGVGEIFANFGTTITEGLTTTFTGAGEQFAQFGTMISEGMTSAQTAAESSMMAIQTTFTTTKDTIQAAWGELPGFFANVFSGLGGAASAAGAAIEAGLTAPIGSILGAWQGAAAQISSIISSISAQAAAMPSIPMGGGGNIPAHAEGGIVSRPEIALIGERSPEAIIPLDGSRHALDLYKKTGEVLGVDSDGEGYSITTGGGCVSTVAPNVTVGNVNVSIEVSGVENAKDFMQAVRENAHEISDIMAAKISEAVASVSRNQPLVA